MHLLARKLTQLSGLALVCLMTAAPGGCTPGEDLTPGLMGVDADGNGVRDDIDALITEKYADTPLTRKIAEDYARSVQRFMEADTPQAAYEAANASGHMINCIHFAIFLPKEEGDNYARTQQLIKDIGAYTANTRERFEKYWNSNRMVGGASFHIETSPVCE